MEFQNQIKFSMNDTYTEFWFSNVAKPRIVLLGLENMLIKCGKDINLVFLDLQYFSIHMLGSQYEQCTTCWGVFGVVSIFDGWTIHVIRFNCQSIKLSV